VGFIGLTPGMSRLPEDRGLPEPPGELTLTARLPPAGQHREDESVSIPTLPTPINPALLRHAELRRQSAENRIADMLWFTAWIALGVERYPYGLLTMIVSLEAIFLSTFVMISQNRADEKRQVLADNEWQKVQAEERQNEQLLGLSSQILALTEAIHAMASARTAANPAGPDGPSGP
jgi:hypothetical protein